MNDKVVVAGLVDRNTAMALDQWRGPYITRSKAISVILKDALNDTQMRNNPLSSELGGHGDRE